MWRVAGSSLRLFSTVQPSMSGRKMSSVIAVGRYCRASASAALPAVRDDALEALVARQAEQDARVVRIVLDDEQHGVAVARSSSRSSATCSSRARPAAPAARPRLRRRASGVGRRGRRARRAGVVQRQVERERAALARHAGQPDLAAEQRRQLAADGQAQAGAAVLAGGAGVGLLERLEDQPLLLRRDADAGVLDRERDDLLARCRSTGWSGDPAARRPAARASSTWPCDGELERRSTAGS